MAIERGMVKFFDEREGKRFGFLLVLSPELGLPTGEQLFFHYNDGEFQYTDMEEPVFIGSTKTRGDKVVRLRTPQKDDILVFRRAQGKKGDVARPWGHAERYDSLVEWLRRRPVFRVVERLKNDFAVKEEDRITEKALWQGQNLFELSARFPKSDAMGSYDALGFSQIEDGYITYDRWFEINKDGEWKEYPLDPRVFDCCVPRSTFLRFAPSGFHQRTCYHSQPTGASNRRGGRGRARN